MYIFLLSVTVEEQEKMSQLTTVQPDQPRGTKYHQRLDTKEEPAVRHEELSVGHVTPTRDPVFLVIFISGEKNSTKIVSGWGGAQ